MSTKPVLEWTDLDSKAVDTVRVLAMDSVQKVGNGHPGTAMSLAPAAYLLFQKVMKHNPADTDWLGRDRFVMGAALSPCRGVTIVSSHRHAGAMRRPV